MTNDLDRIPVPTNGKGPHRAEEPAPPPTDPAEPGELTVSFTPTQIAVGFGIVASLVLLVVGRMRRRGRHGRR